MLKGGGGASNSWQGEKQGLVRMMYSLCCVFREKPASLTKHSGEQNRHHNPIFHSAKSSMHEDTVRARSHSAAAVFRRKASKYGVTGHCVAHLPFTSLPLAQWDITVYYLKKKRAEEGKKVEMEGGQFCLRFVSISSAGARNAKSSKAGRYSVTSYSIPLVYATTSSPAMLSLFLNIFQLIPLLISSTVTSGFSIVTVMCMFTH